MFPKFEPQSWEELDEYNRLLNGGTTGKTEKLVLPPQPKTVPPEVVGFAAGGCALPFLALLTVVVGWPPLIPLILAALLAWVVMRRLGFRR